MDHNNRKLMQKMVKKEIHVTPNIEDESILKRKCQDYVCVDGRYQSTI